MASEWLAIPAGVIAGLGSGWASAWLNRPAASAKAEREAREAEDLAAGQRRLIDEGRELASQAAREFWWTDEIIIDVRFLALRRHLSKEVVSAYDVGEGLLLPSDEDVQTRKSEGQSTLPIVLLDDLDRLEREWQLT